MSLRDIVKRTRERKKAGANQAYPQHAGKATRLPVLAEPVARQTEPRLAKRKLPCVSLGEPTDESVGCETCAGNTQIKLFGCKTHGRCSIKKPVAKDGKQVACCATCDTYQPVTYSTVG